MKKILLASVCAVVSAQATPTSTGFFAELNLGGTYNRFNMQFRPNGVEKKDQSEIAKEHKNAFYVGASVGYGFELNCGFYVGAKVYGLYNNAEIKCKEDDCFHYDVKIKDKMYVMSYRAASAKPQFSYGAAVMVGGAIVPNVLVYAQCGFEGTYWKVKGMFGGVRKDRLNSFISYNGIDDKGVKNNGEIKRNTFSIVPGIGTKYLFNNGLYVGLDCSAAVGLYREIEKKNYDTGVTVTVDENGNTINRDTSPLGKLYTGRNVAFRYGLSLGYKF